jgi:polyhydroxybutyrate depolymerase
MYATGISNGGFFSYRLACDLSDRIAAIAPVAAAMPQALAASCKPAHAVPIVSFSGTSDPLVPYGGGAIGFRFMGKLGDVMPARASLSLWKSLDGCDRSDESTQHILNASANDPLTVDRTVTCSGNLVLYTINGGGHTWPGGLQYLSPLIVGPTSRSLDASSVMWKFLSAHTRK